MEADAELSEVLRLYRDAIEYPKAQSVYRVLSAEAYTKEGLNPSLVVFDEVHVQPTDELWNVMNLGSGTRSQPLVLGITTAGVRSDSTGRDSVCYRLYQYGKRVASGEVVDPTFFFRWFEAPGDADYRDPAVWAVANPALGDFLHLEDFETTIRTVPEADFRIKRLNQWVNSATAWLPSGAFEALAEPRKLEDFEPVVLGFDGSYSGDSTGLVACSLDGHISVIEAWERPVDDPHWRVPIDDVALAIENACRRFRVVEVACDPFRWAREIQRLEGLGIPVVEWPTSSPGRMVPACAKFYDAVVNGNLTHDGDPRLVRHVSNAVVKTDRLGPRIVKEHRESPRKIDLAVCAVIAYDRAVYHAGVPVEVVPTPRFIPAGDGREAPRERTEEEEMALIARRFDEDGDDEAW